MLWWWQNFGRKRRKTRRNLRARRRRKKRRKRRRNACRKNRRSVTRTKSESRRRQKRNCWEKPRRPDWTKYPPLTITIISVCHPGCSILFGIYNFCKKTLNSDLYHLPRLWWGCCLPLLLWDSALIYPCNLLILTCCFYWWSFFIFRTDTYGHQNDSHVYVEECQHIMFDPQEFLLFVLNFCWVIATQAMSRVNDKISHACKKEKMVAQMLGASALQCCGNKLGIDCIDRGTWYINYIILY